MANIILNKEKLYAIMKTSKGLVKVEVKGDRNNHKSIDKWSNHVQESVRRSKRKSS